MGILSELENLKYRPVLDLIKNDEIYDKKRNSLNGNEVFKLLHQRFQKLNDILLPLKEKLGGQIEIIGIKFTLGLQDNGNITIEYIKDDKIYYVSIDNLGFDQVEVFFSDILIPSDTFVHNNKKIFLNIFRRINDFSLDDNILLKSTSGKYAINDLGDSSIISDIDNKIFSLNRSHISNTITKLNCNYPKLKELLEKDDNTLSLCTHLHVYEEDIEKVLSKKLFNN